MKQGNPTNKRQPSFEQERQKLGEILPLTTPFTIIIDVSEVCNFNCNYCFRSMPENEEIYGYTIRNDIMTQQIYEKVLEQLKMFDTPLKRITFSGHGEPLCNRNLPEMIRLLKRQGIEGKTDIHTNASLLDEEYAVDLAQCGIDKIVISIQGMSSAKYKEVCGADIDFEQFFHNLKVLYENKKNTQIYIKTVDAALENKQEEERFYEMFGEISDKVFVEKVVPLFNGVDYKRNEQKFSNKFGENFGKISCCPQIFYTLVVAPDGTIYPCAQPIIPFELGNVSTTTLKEAWDSGIRREFLKSMLKEGRGNIKKCAECYVPQNTVMVREDLIDPYRQEILKKIQKA